jgi:hypothetical protein
MSESRDASQLAALTRGRVVSSALQQAARHEHAVAACLGELDGIGGPLPALVSMTRRRAIRHLDRAASLTHTAMRLNPDPAAAAFIAARLESQERLALRVQRVLSIVGAMTAA